MGPSAARPLDGELMNASISPGKVDSVSDDRCTAEWATRVLFEHGMPPDEIREVLTTEDPRAVRRHLELHRERLVEELIDRRRTLESLERVLVDGLQQKTVDQPSSTVQSRLCSTSEWCHSGSTNRPA